MYGLERQVAERTQRLLDMADGIRMERFLREPSSDEVVPALVMPAASSGADPTVALGGPSIRDCGPAERASRPRAA